MSVRRKLLAMLGLGVFTVLGNLAGTATAQTTVTFQQGVDGYASLFDLFIGRHATNGLDSGNANVAGSSVTDFFIDGRYNTSDDTQGLFRYDNIFGTGSGQIAAGSRILSATLELTTTAVANSDSGGPFGVGQLLTTFDSSTTYNGVGEGFRYFQGGETGRWQSNGFSGTGIDPGLAINADVSKIVQNWANGDANNGFAVTAGTTNGWSVFTSGNTGDVTVTPKLTVTFATPAPPSTQTVYTQSAADSSNSMFLIGNDTDSYANTDTTPYINGNGTFPEVNYLTPSGSNLANGLGQEALIRYDDLFMSQGGIIPDDAIIESAYLLVNTPTYHIDDSGVRNGASVNYDTTSTYSMRQVLTDWDGTGTPSSLTFGSLVDSQFGMIADSESEFDVTSILKNWQNGQGNFGFNLYASDGTGGWGILNSQAGADAPRLVVNWNPVPEPGSFFVLTGLSVLALARRRR